MTTITHSRAADRVHDARRGGFTLVELMIAGGLGGFLLVAVLTGFLFLGRSGANLQNYIDMEAQARRAIETFGEDVRMAEKATWSSATSLVLTVVKSSGTASVTYTYNSTAKTLTRTESGSSLTLLTGIDTFAFKAYNQSATDLNVESAATTTALASVTSSTKQVQLSLRMIRSTQTVVDATNAVISARFILRNKQTA